MVTAKDVAAYILEKKGSLTGFQLQKLLYYAQAWSVAVMEHPIFNDSIEAWEHGPVVSSVSGMHRRRYWVTRANIVDADSEHVPLEDRCTIDAVLDCYGDLSGDELERLTHSELPWKEAFNGKTCHGSAVISLDSMKAYYAELYAFGPEFHASHIVPHFSSPASIVVSDEDFEWLISDEDN